VFLNLFSNSRDALDEKEKNSTQPGLSKNIRVSTRVKKDKIEVIFWDNGIGVSKKDLPRIFDPFFTSKPPGKGTGLGLPIAYGIIHDMQGEITAKSIAASHTSINILLPYHEKH
jgi:signal transduction histidine kinase